MIKTFAKIMIGLAGAISVGVIAAVATKADANATDIVRENVKKARPAEEIAARENAAKMAEVKDGILKHEKDLKQLEIGKWVKEKRYKEREAEALETLNSEVEAVKKSINFSKRLRDIEDKAAADISLVQSNHGYEEAEAAYKAATTAAKASYEKEKALYSMAGSISEEAKETAKKARKSAKKAYEEACEAAKEKFDAVKEAVDAEIREIKANQASEERAVRSELKEKTAQANAKYSEKVAELTREREAAIKDISDGIESSRSEETLDILDQAAKCEKEVRGFDLGEEIVVKDVVENATLTDKIAEYLKNKNVKPYEIWLIGFVIPMIPVVWFITKWFLKVAEVAHKVTPVG